MSQLLLSVIVAKAVWVIFDLITERDRAKYPNKKREQYPDMFIKFYKSSASTFTMWVINWTDEVYVIRSKLNPIIIKRSAKIARPLN